MMTLNVSSGTWSDVVTAACAELDEEDPGTIAMGRALLAALRELDIEVEIQETIPGVLDE